MPCLFGVGVSENIENLVTMRQSGLISSEGSFED